jgi:HisJ family histidinol phosphate phosphatase
MRKVQNFSYHNHTNFSDGKCSLEEMVEQAKAIGFCEMGISDHLIVHKNIEQSPSWPMMSAKSDNHIYQRDFKKNLSEYQKHCEHIRKVSKKENIKLYVGFEVDFFTYDGWLEEFKEFLSQIDYDYLVSGNHFLFDERGETIFNIHKNIADFLGIEQIRELVAHHFINIEKSVESGLFAFLAHFDYVRKMGEQYCDTCDYINEKNAVLDALQQNNVGMEISTKGLRKIDDFYPCAEILKGAAERNIRMVISDDAHKREELGADFDKAEETLAKLGITNRFKL